MIEWTLDGQLVTQRETRDWRAKMGDKKFVKLMIRNVWNRTLKNLYVVGRGEWGEDTAAAKADFKYGFFAREGWAHELSLGDVAPGETWSFIMRLTASGCEGETPRITVEER